MSSSHIMLYNYIHSRSCDFITFLCVCVCVCVCYTCTCVYTLYYTISAAVYMTTQ